MSMNICQWQVAAIVLAIFFAGCIEPKSVSRNQSQIYKTESANSQNFDRVDWSAEDWNPIEDLGLRNWTKKNSLGDV